MVWQIRNSGPIALCFMLGVTLNLAAESKPDLEPTKPQYGTVQRRVLIFDFEDQTGKVEFDYLSGSVADALAEAVKKTGKFELMSRKDARMNVLSSPKTKSKPGVKTKLSRTDAIKQGFAAGADVVVLGVFNELRGVLLFSAQAYEADTRQLKVSEDILSRSNSEMFDGINKLADKIAESMARELPMFDRAEAELRRAQYARDQIEDRNWEIQFFAGSPLLQPLYSSDGTISYAQSFPVQKLKGYSMGATVWNNSLARRFYFLPNLTRFGLQTKLSLLSGTADDVDTNATVLLSSAAFNAIFVSSHLMFGVPVLHWRRFVLFADLGLGAAYTRVTYNGSQIINSVQPSAVLGTSLAYHWSYASFGVSYRAQVAMFTQSQVFLQHDFLIYAGLRI